MLRNSGRLSKNNRFRNSSSVDPMESLANLVDIMLVFACGLMIALITLWDLDLSQVMDVIEEESLVEVDQLEEAIQDGTISEDLSSQGFVYQDEETGKMYIIKKK